MAPRSQAAAAGQAPRREAPAQPPAPPPANGSLPDAVYADYSDAGKQPPYEGESADDYGGLPAVNPDYGEGGEAEEMDGRFDQADTDFDYYGEHGGYEDHAGYEGSYEGHGGGRDLVPGPDYSASTASAASHVSAAMGPVGEESGGRKIGLAAGWAVLALIVVFALGIFFLMPRTVGAALPGATRVYSALGMMKPSQTLAFRNVHYRWNHYQGQLMLEVQGHIINQSAKDEKVPNVLITLQDAKGKKISEWMSPAAAKPLGAGATTPFATQIPQPPDTVRSFKVRFQKAK